MGFCEDPFGAIAQQAGLELAEVIERIRAMLAAGTIRRVRQTLMTTSLAPGALVAWRVPEDRLEAAFDWLVANDPFSGHVVIRHSNAPIDGAAYRLWTTLKVPRAYAIDRHCQLLSRKIGATAHCLMPARKVFVLSVGHIRRRHLQPGSMADQPPEPRDVELVELSALDWRILSALRRELTLDEIRPDLWQCRAAEADVDFDTFCCVAHSLNKRGVIGRFSTFLEHARPLGDGQPLTRFSALFQWAVEPGHEIRAGREVGRFHIMTHAYWRETGPAFNNVNIVGIAHGTDRQRVLDHKAAIDRHLAAEGIPVHFTNIFWSSRSEIRPSEIDPQAYQAFCRQIGVDPATMQSSP